MRLLFRLFLALVLLLPVALATIIYLVFDTSPAIIRSADITPASIERAKRILDQNDPRRLKPGARRTILLRENDLDHAANYLARQYAGGGARIELRRGFAHVGATLRLPALPVDIYLNLETELAETSAGARIARLRLGQLAIPGRLANWMAPRVLAAATGEADIGSLTHSIKKVSIRDDRVVLTYEWQTDLPDKLRTALLSEEDQERLRVYQERLALVSTSLKAPKVPLTELLAPLFALAAERSNGANGVAENRAVILLLALYVNGKDLMAIVPNAKTWPRPEQYEILLNGRADLAKHFIVSSALAAKAGGPLADAVGLYKELADARNGSGFSFNDIAADRAGTRFGEHAADPASAKKLQKRARSGFAEREIIPATDDLPEFMSEREFIRRFGGVDAPAYNNMMAEIERRIAALPLYRRSV